MFKVRFEDGTEELTRSRFDVGEVYEYILEDKPSKSDPTKTYKYVSKPKEAGAVLGQSSRVGGKDPVELLISTGQSYATDLYLSAPFSCGKLEDVVEGITPVMLEAFVSLSARREKGFVSPAMAYAIRIRNNEVMSTRFREAMKLNPTSPQDELTFIKKLFRKMLDLMVEQSRRHEG